MSMGQMASIRFSGNRRTLVILAGVVGLMVGLAYASVPLYKLFCQVTGYGGTTQTPMMLPPIVAGHPITVRFDANVNQSLDWKFVPIDRPVTLNPGSGNQLSGNKYGSDASTGTSTFNVLKAGAYFMKIDCFCFQEQTLQPGDL